MRGTEQEEVELGAMVRGRGHVHMGQGMRKVVYGRWL